MFNNHFISVICKLKLNTPFRFSCLLCLQMKKIIKDILILCVITIICGGLLGYVYQITKNPIQHQSQQSKQDAYLKVMKEATSFKAYKENDIKKLSKKLKGDYGKNGLEIENALKAYI